MKKALGALVFGLAAACFFVLAPPLAERRFNRVLPRQPYQPSQRGRDLHARLLVADLHADALLWGRDLLLRAARGHVDLPRLVEGRVALQAFTVVTQVPRGANVARNAADTDSISLLAFSQRWPPRTWRSFRERALYQAQRLRDTAQRSKGKLVLVRSREELAAFLDRRGRVPAIVGALLGLEGGQALEGDVRNVDVLYDAGFRMASLSHFVDTDLAGSAHGVAKGGLTEQGRAIVRRMEERGIILDLAHASPRTIVEALALARRPVVVSHTGVKGTCDTLRNLTDDEIRGVARTGGIVGIGYWETAICGGDGKSVARAIRHAVAVGGVDHVALGSDFDGAVATPFDTAGLVEVTDALLGAGLSETEIAKVMGENAVRVLQSALP